MLQLLLFLIFILVKLKMHSTQMQSEHQQLSLDCSDSPFVSMNTKGN